MNLSRGACRARGLPQEGAFALVALYAMNNRAGNFGELDGDHEPRKACARAYVGPSLRARRKPQQLSAVGDVAGPD